MSIRIIAEGVHDTAHSVFEAKEILREKPDAVFFELPDVPFQKILNDYAIGKLKMKELKYLLFKAILKEEKRVDHNLVDKFLMGEIEIEELEAIETEGREIHVMQAAKKVGAELVAMDMPLNKVETLIQNEFEQEHIDATKKVMVSENLPNIVWELSDIFHYPYYMIEKIIHHHAIKTTNPFKHNASTCKVCKLGARWDRAVNDVLIPIFDKLPLSKEMKLDIKVAYVIKRIDYYRERYMARKIMSVYNDLTKKLGRPARVLAIVHLWNAIELERLLQGLE